MPLEVGNSLLSGGERGESMKRFFAALAGVVAACALVPATAAADPTVASGGGRGTVDGTHPFSQFGFGVTRFADGSVCGNVNCLLAGSASTEECTRGRGGNMQRNRRFWGLGIVLAFGAAVMLLTTFASAAPGKKANHVRWDIISTTGIPPTPINAGGHASATAPDGD